MTGNSWLCLTTADYVEAAPLEVCTYYNKPEGTTWEELTQTVLTQRFKMKRGPVLIEGIEVHFINLDLDFSDPMAVAIQLLKTTYPIGYLLTEAQQKSYSTEAYYIGTLSQVVDYNNKIAAGENFTGGTSKWADPVENDAIPGQWAVLKHPSYEGPMALQFGPLPQGWLPEVDLP